MPKPVIASLLCAAVVCLATLVDAQELGVAPPAKAPSVAVPQPVDPAVIRQGGDTILDAVPIAIGEQRTGTTTGYTNDYDEVCPYSDPYPDSTAPDVVYTFTPGSAMDVDIDLCGSSYDTKVYVYDEELELVGCNDDAYYDDNCGLYVSRIEGLPVDGGLAYFLVIDGYGDANGEYQLDLAEFTSYESSCHGVPLVFEEEEPTLHAGYLDTFNGGCTSPDPGHPMQDLPLHIWSHQCFHGRSGWYVNASGMTYRDTDWFVTVPVDHHGYFLDLDADEPCHFFVLEPQDCGSVDVVESWTFGGEEYGEQTMVWGGDPGERLWVWVGPTTIGLPPGHDEAYEFDYYLYAWGDLPVEARSWSAIKSVFD
jgi:hypothetical protein